MNNQIMYFLLVITLATYFIGALASILSINNQKVSLFLGSAFALIASFFGILISSLGLINNSDLYIQSSGFQNLLPINLHLGSLASLFILVITSIGLITTIYGTKYMTHNKKDYNLGSFFFFYNLFLLSMILVVLANNAIFFIYSWEIMALTSLFLVLFEHKQIQTVKAGIVYFLMTHIGTFFIAIAFFILYKATGSFDFEIIKANFHLIPENSKTIIFLLFVIGFGTKAGIIPFHIWLPRAHGSAPSQVSALMSGVMIKMGIYMMIRMFIEVLTNQPAWWGITILLLGAASSILGVLYALAEHDIKKLLAYHSIENIGIILMGIGASMYFKSIGKFDVSNLALIAAIFHTINHAIFKSLLFLSAGSVILNTETKNIEKYGGLIKKMPYTALFFLIGAVAISGLPPFNGFASEWLTFNSLFAGIHEQSSLLKLAFVSGVSSLAFTGGLAAACFVKAFGATFLARPRGKESEKAIESPKRMIFSMGILALLCIVLGLFSKHVISALSKVTSNLLLTKSQSTTEYFISLNLSNIFVVLLVVLAIVYFFIKFISRNRKVITDITWSCGFDYVTPRAEITSTGFARSLILIFRGIFIPSKQSTIEYVDANMNNRYFTKSKKVMLTTLNIYETYLYKPMDKFLSKVSEKVKIVQSGNINTYLFYIMTTLIITLVWARYF